jgi:serine-type D-Ala-D-Ala carboxypeptidase/endopeptidase (penicillin-binding protein 4)
MNAAQRRFRAGVAVVATTLVPAICLVIAWQLADAHTVPPPHDPAPAVELTAGEAEMPTGLFSFRRSPAPIAEQAKLDAVAALTDPLLTRLGSTSCVMVMHGSDVVAAANPDLAFASSTSAQLVLAAVALDVLGPDFRFRTEVRAATVVDGVVQGDVYLVGGGDPDLVTAGHLASLTVAPSLPTVLDGLADAVVAAGVVGVNGNVVGDGTRYDDEYVVPSWDPALSVTHPPYDALLLDDGRVEGGGVGLNPSQAAASRFNGLLADRGILIAGRNRNGPAPTDGVVSLGTVESAPLVDIVADLFVTGDPTTAELLLKELGVVTAGSGTRHAGLDAVQAKLTEWGVPVDGLVLEDGSGLSATDQVSCRTLAAIVAHAGASSPLAAALPALDEAQAVGTAGSALAAPTPTVVRAHGSSRTDQRALTGLLAGDDGDALSFSIVLAEPGAHDESVFGPVRDLLVALLRGDRTGPDVADLGPR